jgi:hypothetical protein
VQDGLRRGCPMVYEFDLLVLFLLVITVSPQYVYFVR